MVERIGREEGSLLAQEELNRAMDELKAAKVLHENGLFYKSVASAYCAVYHTAKAALLIKGVVPQSHEGVERMFSLLLCEDKGCRNRYWKDYRETNETKRRGRLLSRNLL